MMGRVNARSEPILSLTVHGPTGVSRQVDALVDTGFGGQLTLPPSLVRVLALPWFNRDYAVLADGTITWFNLYLAVVDCEGSKRQISVQSVDAQPLIGTDLLLGHDLIIRMIHGGPVTISAIP